jgi:hypothetical protein
MAADHGCGGLVLGGYPDELDVPWGARFGMIAEGGN